MAFGNLYSFGLASTDPGSPQDTAKIFGNGTLWGTGNGNVRAGDSFERAGIRVTILSVEGDEELTLAYAWPGDEFTDQTYIIRQESPQRHTPSELAGRTSELLSLLNIYKRSVAIFTVEEFGINTPPVDYALDEMLVVGTAPTGVFSDHSKQIAQKTANGWTFFNTEEGWITIDLSSTPHVARVWNDTASEWQAADALLGAPINRGPWDSGTNYQAANLVSHLNVIWSADQDNLNSEPGSSPSDWSEWLTIGEHGGALTLPYFFRTSTLEAAADVAGQLNLDAVPGSATVLRLNPVDAFGNDWTSTLASLGDGTSATKGRGRLIVPGDPTRQWQAKVISVTSDGSPLGHYELALEVPELGSNTFLDNSLVLFMWTDAGDIGETGTQGVEGDRGAIGGPIAIPYVFSTETADADPTPGKLRLGTATQKNSVVIRADVLNSALADVTALLDAVPVIGTGAIVAIGSLDHALTPESKWLKFKVTAFATPGGGGYRNITIEMLAWSADNPFAADDPFVLNLYPLLVGATGDTGATGATGAAFEPDHVVASLDDRGAYDTEPVGTSVLVEFDESNNGKATLYFLQDNGSPVEWSSGTDFAPSANADAITFDNTKSDLETEEGEPVDNVQDAIDALKRALTVIEQDTSETPIDPTDAGPFTLEVSTNKYFPPGGKVLMKPTDDMSISLIGKVQAYSNDDLLIEKIDTNAIVSTTYTSWVIFLLDAPQNKILYRSINGLRISSVAANQIIVSSGSVRDFSDTIDLVWETTDNGYNLSQDWDDVSGLGLAVKTANLAGTISSAGAAVTGTSTAFVADFGDPGVAASRPSLEDFRTQIAFGFAWSGVNDTNLKSIIRSGSVTTSIADVASDTALTTDTNLSASGAAYTRGGKAEAASPALDYAIVLARSDATGISRLFGCSFYNNGDLDAVPDLPTGYTYYRVFGRARTVASAGGPITDIYQPLVYYNAPEKANVAHTAAVDPTANDDSEDGFIVGSLWINTTTQVSWRCMVVTASAAVWVPMQVNDHPGYLPSSIYSTWEGSVATGTAVPAVDTLYLYPYFIREKFTLASLQIRVATAGTGSSVKLAVYANLRTGSNRGKPTGAPLAVNNTGAVTTSSGATVSLAASATLPPGVYWFAQKHTGTLPQCMSLAANSGSNSTLLGSAALTNAPVIAWSMASTYSANMPTLDGTETWTRHQTTGIPVVHIGN